MLSRLFCAAIAAIACVNAATPGVPTILQVPLNTTLYPSGFTGTTTNATSYEIVPIDQVAFMVPTNALSVRIQVDSPDQTNSWWAYDISSLGPLCLLSGNRAKSGYTCGGLTTSADHRTDASYNFTFDASGASEDSSGFKWATGTYFYYGFTSDTSFTASPIPYVLRSITIETCPTGFIGGYYGSATACIPLQNIGSSTNSTFSYIGGSTGLTLELTVPAMTGAMTVTFTVPRSSIGTLEYDPDVRGASMGFPSSYNAECSSESTVTGETDIVTTFTCASPASGRYYVHFDGDTTANFTGTVSVNYTICNASRAGDYCEDNLINLGNVTTANNATSFSFAIPAGNSTQYKLTVPAGTNYGFNITFTQDDSDYTYANLNNYASSDAYPNSNWQVSASGSTPFVFQPQQNAMGHVVYFHIPSDSDATTVNITISTTGVVIPTSTTRTTSISSTQTQTGTTTDARSNSSILIASIAMTLLALVF